MRDKIWPVVLLDKRKISLMRRMGMWAKGMCSSVSVGGLSFRVRGLKF